MLRFLILFTSRYGSWGCFPFSSELASQSSQFVNGMNQFEGQALTSSSEFLQNSTYHFRSDHFLRFCSTIPSKWRAGSSIYRPTSSDKEKAPWDDVYIKKLQQVAPLWPQTSWKLDVRLSRGHVTSDHVNILINHLVFVAFLF